MSRWRIHWRVVAFTVAIPIVAALGFAAWMVSMPGTSFQGVLPPLDGEQTRLARELQDDVTVLAHTIGERNLHHPRELERAAGFISEALKATGLKVERETFQVHGAGCVNLVAEMRGSSLPSEIVVLGAHYDSVRGSPGANDNASGTAALLALARRLSKATLPRTVRFVAFTNEEPPYYRTNAMGSVVNARGCKARGENIVAMLSIETIGFYADDDASQRYPIDALKLVYPARGNFVAFSANLDARQLVRTCVGEFRARARFPCEGAVLPDAVPGSGWSDHWSFAREGFPAAMVTDTALFRYEHYHRASDVPEQLDYERMARVVDGLRHVVEGLASE